MFVRQTSFLLIYIFLQRPSLEANVSSTMTVISPSGHRSRQLSWQPPHERNTGHSIHSGAGVKLRHKKKQLQQYKLMPLIQKPRGKYTTKVEIQKAETDDHPCMLEKTTVKIQFPDMKAEVFVNFLGYKEPNLMYLTRCKGWCPGDIKGKRRRYPPESLVVSTGDGQGEEIISEEHQHHHSGVLCGPVKVRQKKVKMMVKTQLIGRDPSVKMKELILEEHVECGCQESKCNHVPPNYCAGNLNNVTCECECDEVKYGAERNRCEKVLVNGYWDEVTCQCLNKSISPRGVDYYHHVNNPDCNHPPGFNTNSPLFNLQEEKYSNTEVLCWVLLGCCITICIFLAATTFYYRNKIRNIIRLQRRNKENKQGPVSVLKDCSKRKKRKDYDDDGQERTGGRVEFVGLAEPHEADMEADLESSGVRKGGAYSVYHQQPQSASQQSAPPQPTAAAPTLEEIMLMQSLTSAGELYHEQYNEHGVRIEKELSDNDLIQKYLGVSAL